MGGVWRGSGCSWRGPGDLCLAPWVLGAQVRRPVFRSSASASGFSSYEVEISSSSSVGASLPHSEALLRLSGAVGTVAKTHL